MKETNRRALACVVVMLAFIGAGCGRPQMAVSNDPAIAPDADFDLLDEQFEQQDGTIADPLEGWNRAVFVINDRLYFWVAKPVLTGYRKVVIEPVRTGIRNAFNNLGMPVRAVNCLLQGKFKGADIEVRRFLINTTVGVLGVRDVAQTKYNLLPVKEDLGQTLGVFGLGDGCYLVWPLLGPSSLRDSAGTVGDTFLNALRYVDPCWVAPAAIGAKEGNEGSFRLGEYERFKAESLDPYVAMREAYIQYRNKQIQE